MQTGTTSFSQKKPDQLVYLELGGGNGGMLLSISEDGFRFRAVAAVRASGELPFAFSLDGTHRLEGNGVVDWVEEDGKSGGLRFTQVTPEFRAAVRAWLAADSALCNSGSQVMPAAETRLDMMEKIRQELRAGYPARPPANAAADLPVNTALRNPEPSNFESALISGRKPAKPKFEESPPIAEKKTEKPSEKPTEKDFPAAKRAPSLTQRPIQSNKPATAPTSAFRKPSPPAKTSPLFEQPVVETISARSATTPHFVTSAPAESLAQSRPYVPPLEDSFEAAWQRAKLSAPPESPRANRAAAGTLVAVALLAILGAFAFNYRQEIGGVMVQLGRSISGEPSPTVPSGAESGQPSASHSDAAAQTGAAPAAANLEASKPAPEVTPTAKTEPPANPQPARTENVTKSAVHAPDSVTSAASTTSKPLASAAHNAVKQQPAPADLSEPDNAAAKALPSSDEGNGAEAFIAARDIMRGRNRQREMSRAVELLWSGVRQGYVPAEVTLGDLFRRGDGVEKNCDQARVLLVAASRKGSADARLMLEQMAEQGCQ